MKNALLVGVMMAIAGSLTAADLKGDITAAAKKVGATSYGWKSSVESPGGQNRMGGPSEGKISKDGVVFSSTTRGENTTEVYCKGEKGAMKTQDGWKSFAEMLEGDGQQNRGAFMVRRMQTFKAPAEEVVNLVAKVKELKSADGVISGDLSEDGVKDALAFGPRREGVEGPKIEGGKGSVKVWIKDGQLSKYELRVEGKMTFGERDIEINRTTTTEIKNVGSTSFEVPAEAKDKMK